MVDEGGRIDHMIQKALHFFKESYEELRRVTWLGRKEVIASTIVVIILVMIIALYVFCIDFVLSRVISYIL
jgi:preprotein translocase subunit SecE